MASFILDPLARVAASNHRAEAAHVDPGVERGRRDALVAQQFLDLAYVGAAFEEVCGVGVPQRMDMRPFVDPALLDGPHEGGLEARARDGTRARRDEV